MPRGRPLDVEQELLEAFRHSGRVNEYLVSVLPASLWLAAPPTGRGRSIAATVAHMQGVRRTFARMGGARPGPPSLDRRMASPAQARRAFQRSTEDLVRLFESALECKDGSCEGHAASRRRHARLFDTARRTSSWADLPAGAQSRPHVQRRRHDADMGMEAILRAEASLQQPPEHCLHELLALVILNAFPASHVQARPCRRP